MDARTDAAGAVDWLRLRSVRSAWRAGALAILSGILSGCQADPNMQLVERELRLQDRHIFELEEHLADCHSTVAAYRREIASLRRRLDDDEAPASEDPYKDGWDADTRLRPPPPSTPSLPEIDEGDAVPYTPQPAVPEEMSPLRDLYAPAVGEPTAPLAAPPGESVSFPRPAETEEPQIHDSAPSEEELPPPDRSSVDDSVEQIGLRLMVRYHAAENTPVELRTLIEPQDGQSQQVLSEGDVSLMVVSTDGESERPLARWDFSEDEARGRWRRSRLGTGMLFELPWPGTPEPGSYRLWARMMGEDGRKYLSSADFEVQEPALAARPPKPQPIEVAELQPEPAGELEPEPEPSERYSTAGAEPSHQSARQPQPEPRGASPAEIAWKTSVEAARLPRLPHPAPPTLAAAGESPAEQGSDDGRLVPWSPERPGHAGPGLQAARDVSDWSPYR